MNEQRQPVECSSTAPEACRNWEPGELKQIAHIKRFLECVQGDPEFRGQLEERPEDCLDIAVSRGIQIDPTEIEMLWKNGRPACVEPEELRTSPLGSLWADWIDARKAAIAEYRKSVSEAIPNRRFKAWHMRQVARCGFEVGTPNDLRGHSVLVFELTKGCSVGCWFCGLDAGRLQGIFRRTPENRRLWREILRVCREELGESARGGFCYWATEPSDNPDYLDFLEDFRDLMGVVPGTTSAAWPRDLDWTRKLVRRARSGNRRGCRFSITNLQDLHTIHELFTPEKLLTVELILQNTEALVPFRTSGRYRELWNSDSPPPGYTDEEPNPSTIACVSGFLVNMVDKTIRLVSPCYSTDNWPLGYRVYWEGTFSGPDSFRVCVRQAIDDVMHDGLKGGQVLSFHCALSYERLPEGFNLESIFRKTTITGKASLGAIGDLIAEGRHTTAEIIEAVTEAGHDYFQVIGALQHVFQKGLIDDDPAREQRYEAKETA